MAATDSECDIGISAEGEHLAAIADDFCRDVRSLGINVAAEARPRGSIKASLDWVIPTAVALFIANKYLGTLVQEAAKDHYPKLKAAFLKLARRTTGTAREVRLTVVTSSSAKLSDVDPVVLSVWIQLHDSRRAVFRFDHTLSSAEVGSAVDALFELLRAHVRNDQQDDLLGRAPSAMPMSPSTPVVMRFDSEIGRWRCWVLDRHGRGRSWPDGA